MSSSRGFHDIVERQGLSYEARQRAASEQPVTPASAPHEPWITISRQPGSGGDELASRLAARLGWRVCDKEIVTAIAADAHSTESVVRGRDERAAGVIEEHLAALMVPQDAGQAAYLDRMTRVIAQIAQQGQAIIVGRGANWFLDPARGLRLRVIAPAATRAEKSGKSAAQLRALETARRAFVRQAFRQEIDDPLGYDLVINLGTLPLEAAVDLVIAALQSRFPDRARVSP